MRVGRVRLAEFVLYHRQAQAGVVPLQHQVDEQAAGQPFQSAAAFDAGKFFLFNCFQIKLLQEECFLFLDFPDAEMRTVFDIFFQMKGQAEDICGANVTNPSMHIRKLAQLTGHNASIFALAEGRDGQHFLSGAGDGWVAEWDFQNPETGRLIAKVDAQIFSLLFLKKYNRLVVGNMNGGLHWVDLQDANLTKNIAHHQKGVFDIREVREEVFTIGGEGKITRWQPGDCRSVESLHLSHQALRCMDVCEKRNEIAIGSSDNNIYFLDAETLELKQTIEGAHANSVFSLRYSPDASYLLSGGRDAHLNVWDLENRGEKLRSEPAHWFTINDIAFHPDGIHFATASRDKTLKIWNLENFQLLKVLEPARDGGHKNSVNKLLWAKHGNTLLSCGDDRTIILWKID